MAEAAEGEEEAQGPQESNAKPEAPTEELSLDQEQFDALERDFQQVGPTVDFCLRPASDLLKPHDSVQKHSE